MAATNSNIEHKNRIVNSTINRIIIENGSQCISSFSAEFDMEHFTTVFKVNSIMINCFPLAHLLLLILDFFMLKKKFN